MASKFVNIFRVPQRLLFVFITMKNEYFIGLKSIICFVLICCCNIGCSHKYATVPYHWNSDYHLSPYERQIETDVSPSKVKQRLIDWIVKKGGEVNYDVVKNMDYDEFTEANVANYKRARELAEKEWHSFEINDFDERLREEGLVLSQNLIALSYTRIEKGPVNILGGLLPDKNRCFDIERKSAGINMQTLNSPIGTVLPSTAVVTRTHTESVCFKGQLFFYLYQKNQKTYISGFGVPYDVINKKYSKFGETIEYSNWKFVTGKQEAKLIKEAFAFILNNVDE